MTVACSGRASLQPSTTAPTHTHATTTTVATTPTTAVGPIRGALPDGVIYDIAFPTPRAEEIVEIGASILAQVEGAEVPLRVTFARGAPKRPAEVHAIPAGQWTVEIETPEGLDGETLIEGSIEVTTEVDMPVLTLRPPLRWATPPEVAYDSFVVTSGCPDRAVACNPTHAVGVTPNPGETLEEPISIQSYALRPPSDSNHLDPGPLTARWSPDVIWTGNEMIVWGGSESPGRPHLVDGAAYDPKADEWRVIADSPLQPEQPTRAVWAGDEMVVVAEEATVAWDPRSNEWRGIASGTAPPLEPGMTLWMGSQIVTWTENGLRRLQSDGSDWTALPDPGVGQPGLDASVLRLADSGLVAIGEDDCDRLVSQWEGERWTRPTRTALSGPGPSCGRPNQTAVIDDLLVLWDDATGNVVSHDLVTGETRNLARFPLTEREHSPGPLHLDDRFLVTAGLDGAIFDPSTGQWVTVELPGLGTDVDMVWTGEEVLMWDKCCYGPEDVDAWRWSPPPP